MTWKKDKKKKNALLENLTFYKLCVCVVFFLSFLFSYGYDDGYGIIRFVLNIIANEYKEYRDVSWKLFTFDKCCDFTATGSEVK